MKTVQEAWLEHLKSRQPDPDMIADLRRAFYAGAAAAAWLIAGAAIIPPSPPTILDMVARNGDLLEALGQALLDISGEVKRYAQDLQAGGE